MPPSLVTCPTNNTGILRSLARAMIAAATARTWLVPPAEPSTSAEAMVCTESTISSAGLACSTWPSTAPSSVSAASSKLSAKASMRAARRRTWEADSSPVMYRTLPAPVSLACLAALAATVSSRVDLPTPGSPASKITAPGTIPPPSTRSSSPTPLGRAWADSALT